MTGSTVRDQRYELTSVDEVRPHPDNAKLGDTDAIGSSIERTGFYGALVVQRSTGYILVGNHRWKAAKAKGLADLPVIFVDCDADEARRIMVADNRTSDLGTYDSEKLVALLSGFDGDLDGTGYSAADLAALLGQTVAPGLTDPDEVPEPPPAKTVPGDVWLLGPHRVMCGDSTNKDEVDRLVDGAILALIHADPPYGMGKEADGVLNDNLYGGKLDEFQMRWWNAWLGSLDENGSAYIWGNAPDLWRLWWVGGLAHDDLLVRNELVWDKGSAIGMRSALEHSYPNGTERCLFLMRGQQFLGNQNKDDYWEGYEPLRSWLEAERDRVCWTNRDVNDLTGTQMAGHWFSKSQFAPISANHYRTLQDAASGRAFVKNYDELFAEMFPEVKGGGNAYRRELSAELRESRTFFDNSHDVMRDVWEFPRVAGADRQGHATPKPVAMIERAIKTSSEPGDTIGVPFGGSGPDFIAAHRLGRVCYGMELDPRYVDVICRRWQEHTGEKPIAEATGRPHDFTA